VPETTASPGSRDALLLPPDERDRSDPADCDRLADDDDFFLLLPPFFPDLDVVLAAPSSSGLPAVAEALPDALPDDDDEVDDDDDDEPLSCLWRRPCLCLDDTK
jgi:hypothetical protein